MSDNRMLTVLLGMVFALVFSIVAEAKIAVVMTKDGREVEGEGVSEDADTITLMIAKIKTAMKMMGMDSGTLRLPLCEMAEENLAGLQALLEKQGLLAPA